MSAPAAVPRVPVIIRSEWGAPKGLPAGLKPLGEARTLVVHHTAQGYTHASRAGMTAATGAAAARAVRVSHLQRRFADVGYHWLIDGDGRVYQGRAYLVGGALGPGMRPPTLARGEHVKNHNAGTIGVCLFGCFGAAGTPDAATCSDTPSPAALDTLARLAEAIRLAYGVERLRGHRDLRASVCPGDKLYELLPRLRAASRLA